MSRAIELALTFTILAAAACADAAAVEAPPQLAGPAGAAPDLAAPDVKWGRYHSRRFRLSFPLPDGRAWKIDDRTRPELVAIHPATGSRVMVLARQDEELVNRSRCEARARSLGFVPDAPLTTVEDDVAVGPEAYDSRVWVALDAGRPDGRLEGHVFLFGAFLRRCLLVHFATAVPSSRDEGVLSSRLAVARARIIGGIALDPLRVTDDATVPRDDHEIQK